MTTREKLIEAICQRIEAGCVVPQMKATMIAYDEYEEFQFLKPLTILEVYSDGAVVAEEPGGQADEYALYELTGDSLMQVLDALNREQVC